MGDTPVRDGVFNFVKKVRNLLNITDSDTGGTVPAGGLLSVKTLEYSEESPDTIDTVTSLTSVQEFSLTDDELPGDARELVGLTITARTSGDGSLALFPKSAGNPTKPYTLNFEGAWMMPVFPIGSDDSSLSGIFVHKAAFATKQHGMTGSFVTRGPSNESSPARAIVSAGTDAQSDHGALGLKVSGSNSGTLHKYDLNVSSGLAASAYQGKDITYRVYNSAGHYVPVHGQGIGHSYWEMGNSFMPGFPYTGNLWMELYALPHSTGGMKVYDVKIELVFREVDRNYLGSFSADGDFTVSTATDLINTTFEPEVGPRFWTGAYFTALVSRAGTGVDIKDALFLELRGDDFSESITGWAQTSFAVAPNLFDSTPQRVMYHIGDADLLAALQGVGDSEARIRLTGTSVSETWTVTDPELVVAYEEMGSSGLYRYYFGGQAHSHGPTA